MNKTKHKEVEKGNEIEMHELYRILHTKKGTVVDERFPAAYARYKEVRNEYQRKAHESSHEVTPQEPPKAKKRCWKKAEGGYNKDILHGLGPLATQLKPVHVGSSLGGSTDVPPLWAQEMKAEFKNFQQTITSKIDTFMDTFMQSQQRPHFPQHPHYQNPVHPWHQAPQTPYHPSYQPHIPIPQYPAQPGVPQLYPPYPQIQYPFTSPGSHSGSNGHLPHT